MRKICAGGLLVGVMLCGWAKATVEYSAGQGANSATIEVDFNGSQIFSFGYNWNGSATAWDALSAISAAGALGVSATNWGTPQQPDYFVDDISYPGAAEYPYTSSAGWALYDSTDGIAWTLDGNGASYDSLSSGEYNAWVWTNYDESWNPIREPGQMPTPEPTALALLGLGAVAMMRRKK